MFTKIKPFVACWLVLLAFSISSRLEAQEGEKEVDFVKQIQPIFEGHCVRCHGEVDAENMRIDQHDSVLDYIDVNDAENSQLYEHLISDDEDMLMPPPDEMDPLSKDEIELVARWINEGAKWPEGLQLADRYQEAADDSAATNDPAMGTDSAADEGKEPEATGETSQDEPAVEGEAKGKPADSKPAKPAKAAEDENTVYWAIGSLHPAAVHLPIGLLLAAGFFALLGLRGNFVMSDCAYYCLWLGTLGCIIACVSGWWMSPLSKMGTVSSFSDLWDQDHRVFWHRTSGLVVTILSLLLALFAAGARNRDPDDGVMWKLGVILLAAGVAWTGHKGGELTHGKQHYKHLYKLFNSVFPMDEGIDQAPPAKKNFQQEAAEPDGTGGVIEEDIMIDTNNDGKPDIGLGRDI